MVLKLAVVGGGPSAFYVASRILSLLPDAPSVAVHMYDRLWSPHGLVRYGVAPDHPEVKNCTHKFDTLANDARFRFFGNVNVISPVSPPSRIPHALNVPVESLLGHYTHLLLASGSALPVTHPRLRTSATCVPALDLVHWYTQHPVQSTPPPLKSTTHMTIIGHGNVSLDIARMLLSPVSTLAKYDVPEPVLQHLSESSIRHVSIIGRRDPASVKFTAKELRELMNIPDVSLVPIPSSLFPTAGAQLTRQQSRILDIMRAGSKAPYGSTSKTVSIDFMRSPSGYDADNKSLQLDVTRLDTDGIAQATGDTESVQTDLTVMSMGYTGEPMGLSAEADSSWFDSKLGHLRTRAGQVYTAPDTRLRNVYASGWAAHGARGVLNTTMMDAYAVAQRIIGDYLASEGAAATPTDQPEAQEAEVMNERASLFSLPPEILTADAQKGGPARVFSYRDWKTVDEAEQERGRELGKERERMQYWDAIRVLDRS
ncbi:nucleotide-binding domain-containing protein [Exidia glandulosa HHB12029]|uniref:NADPH:adrenodoxin oxidoreductase, mitochondrial n=1 Tax=Exidia glandulosa HHB12029 TaxID=1314781 RepID=A0A165JH00_EXIGL|nr:nucleotide-binding domain-containing protein [Exidia glandulosa HHB12029]